MKTLVKTSFKYVLFVITCASAAIVPEELPSLLSVAYSNIPPIKKGTDSRVGFGFSLGNHADFQVMFEFGPQIYTNPVGSSYAASSKRQTKPKKSSTTQRDKLNDSDGGKFLAGWSQNMKQKKTNKPYAPLAIPDDDSESGLGTIDLTKVLADMKDESEGEIVLSQPVLPQISADAMSQLKQLYGEKIEVQPTLGLASSISPKFVLKKNVANGHNADRLAGFNVDEDENVEAQKKKITEELSDVSLDDE
ncbi:snustorr snarlik [Arctopsyche grandis]|uniref:snustorr snarlik n=1 Tax=Arctopsyche grandis TaxID=121162 RepID=UPI00406D9D2D